MSHLYVYMFYHNVKCLICMYICFIIMLMSHLYVYMFIIMLMSHLYVYMFYYNVNVSSVCIYVLS